MMDTSDKAIYRLYFNNIPNSTYIGFSTQVHVRKLHHYAELARGTHRNIKLQNYYNKYGLPLFEILEYCPGDSLEDLKRKEISYIVKFNSFKEGLNLTNGGESGGFGEGNNSAKYTLEQYLKVYRLLAFTSDSTYKISEQTGVSIGVVKNISSGKAHTYLAEVDPEAAEALARRRLTKDNSAKSQGIKYPPVVSPEGIVYSNIENLTQFAKEHNLQAQNLSKLLKGERKTHLGWKLA